MNKSEFQLPNGGEILYTLHIGIPGNTAPIGVRVDASRYHKAEVLEEYDHKVEYAVSGKNGKTYFQEA